MKKIVITTTINKPTAAIRKYDALKDWGLIVVGDRKSPARYGLKNGMYISWREQQERYSDLCRIIGPDSTSRGRLIGIIAAYKAGADIIATIDDDNYPCQCWGKECVLGVEKLYEWYNCNVFDPVSLFHPHIWHRGYPLELRKTLPAKQPRGRKMRPLMQANLWNGDPDVDAMMRLTGNLDVEFPGYIMPFGGGKFSPVNSQNTMFLAEYARDYFVGPGVGRIEDIWGSYIFQAKHPYSTVYASPTVNHQQKRTQASLIQDLQDEMFGYKYTHKFLLAIMDKGLGYAMNTFCPDVFMEAYDCYRSYFK